MNRRSDAKRIDLLLALCIIVLFLAIPVGIKAYDNYFWERQIAGEAKIFTLTGHTEMGWILGDVKAGDIFSLWKKTASDPLSRPVIEVSRGDRVVLKLKSSDVIHGFSLKDLGIFITDGIQPGKVTTVSFLAEKTGTYTFSCNAICGSNHEVMQGTLIVRA